MSVAEINALLYSPEHSRERMQRALRIAALSPGWRSSFEALLRSQATTGNAGLTPAAAGHPAAPGFRPLVVTTIAHESADVFSVTMRAAHDEPLPVALPGQYVVLRLRPTTGGSLFRSYSLSGPISTERYRLSIKVEPKGVAGTYLRDHVQVGDDLDVSSPRGSFVLEPGERPVVLLSAGIGVTPVLAMLHALASAASARQVVWLHGARDGQHHPFGAEARRLLLALPRSRGLVCYSQPGSRDKMGQAFDTAGHLSRRVLEEVGVPRDADVYLCGPNRFMAEMKDVLAAIGVAKERIHVELFQGSESITPGVVGAATRPPHLPKDEAKTGPLVSFARSGLVVHWDGSRYRNILELAEACDVPVRWSCRTGVCHTCECGLVSGAVEYGPEPLEKPANGNILACCCLPTGNVVVDL
jgi:ferredoxin-NADP reductase